MAKGKGQILEEDYKRGRCTVKRECNQNEEENTVIPQEPFKTLISGLFLCSGFLATTISTAVTHDYVPTNTSSLPDFILDHVTYQHWGLYVSEIFLVVNVLFAFIVVVFHAFRIIIFRYHT